MRLDRCADPDPYGYLPAQRSERGPSQFSDRIPALLFMKKQDDRRIDLTLLVVFYRDSGGSLRSTT